MSTDTSRAADSAATILSNLYPTTRYAWYTVALLLMVYTFSFIDRQILGILGPTIIRDFQISDTQFGLLTGPAFAIFYTLFGLYCARIADSRSRKGLIAVGLALWSLMTTLSGFAKNFALLFTFRIGVGVGEATLAPAANSLIADSFPKERLSTALSVYSMGIPVGSALAFLAGGLVLDFAGALPDITVPGVGTLAAWQKAFIIVGLPGLLLTVFVMTLNEPSRKGVAGTGAAFTISETLAQMKAHWKAYTGLMIAVSCTAMLGFGSVIWLTSFFDRSFGVPASNVASTFGLIALVTGPLGLMLGGLLADRWVKNGVKDAHVRALIIAPIAYTVPAALFPILTLWLPAEEVLSYIWIIIAWNNTFINLPSGVAYASLQIITPNQARGQIIAAYVLATNILGYGGGPLLIGYLSDNAFSGPNSLAYAMATIAAVTGPIAVALYLWCRKAFIRAVEAEEARLNAG